ncbi:MAG: formylglycine-generating enzyme family protein [Elusimicrobiota bacterium]|nr:MAG: formylglycine-generating enzyme family protein [Elusimicrobiota bacterium]
MRAAAAALLALAACAAPPRAPAPVDIDWVRIPAGSFWMGSGEFETEQPVHKVTLKAFDLARTETTNRQYAACVAAGACEAQDPDCLGPAFRGPEQPAVCVSWDMARAFAAWAGGRLPSEAEWEYAARGAGGDGRYAWGDAAPDCSRVVFGDSPEGPGCGRGATWPVCSKPLGNTPQGLCDMGGNVWEWTEDRYHADYRGAPADGSAWVSEPATPLRSDRGGQWDGDAHNLRVWNRDSEVPAIRAERGTGFRIARDAR